MADCGVGASKGGGVVKRSRLERKSGLSARGKGGACPPKPSGAERNGIGRPKREDTYDGRRWREQGLAICPDCELCGHRADDVHHLIYRQALRRTLSAGVYAVAAMDQRNAMCLCRKCHNEMHARTRPIWWHELPVSVHTFAADHGLTWLLERTYPEYPGVQA